MPTEYQIEKTRATVFTVAGAARMVQTLAPLQHGANCRCIEIVWFDESGALLRQDQIALVEQSLSADAVSDVLA